jgi:uncharacterized protein involved in exopolysaccharide biosynthesis
MPAGDLAFLTDLSRAMRRYWFRGLLAFGLIAGGMGGLTLLWPRTYQSEARMYVRLGRETVQLDPTATTGGQMVGLADSREREILSALELLRTRSLFENVVDELGVESFLNEERVRGYGGSTDQSHLVGELFQWLPKFESAANEAAETSDVAQLRRRENAVRMFMQAVSSSSPKNSNVIIVQCKAGSPVVAQQRLDALLKQYQAQHLRLHQISGSFAFFDTQALEKKTLLDAKLIELRDAKNRIGVASVNGQQELLSREATSITQSLLDAQAAAAASKVRLDSLLASLPEAERAPDTRAASNMSSDAIDMMRSRLFELEIEYQRLLAQLQPAHPKLKAITEQVAQARQELKRQEVVLERSNILEQEEKIAAAKSQRSEVYAKLRDLNEQELHIADLERQVALLTDEHRKAEESRELAHTNEELARNQISNINLAQSPSFNAKPVAPNLALNAVMGIALAMAGSLMIVFQSAVRHGAPEFVHREAPVYAAPRVDTVVAAGSTPEVHHRALNRPKVSSGV